MSTTLYAPYDPYRGIPEPHLYFGLDLGRRRDPAAFVILERNSIRGAFDHAWRQHHRHILFILRHAERFPLGLPYLTIVDRLSRLLHSTTRSLPGNFELLPGHELNPRKTLAVDATGVGSPVVELLRRAQLQATLVPITITSGSRPAKDSDGGHLIPRRDLVTNLRVLLETGALKIPEDLRNRDDVVTELAELEDTPTRRHDDLALALALAAWSAAHSLR
jgi:hypothetical protein